MTDTKNHPTKDISKMVQCLKGWVFMILLTMWKRAISWNNFSFFYSKTNIKFSLTSGWIRLKYHEIFSGTPRSIKPQIKLWWEAFLAYTLSIETIMGQPMVQELLGLSFQFSPILADKGMTEIIISPEQNQYNSNCDSKSPEILLIWQQKSLPLLFLHPH